MTAVPTGWSEASLGDVCTIVSGATPKTGVPEYWGGDVAWLTPNDMSRDRSQTLLGGERSLTEAGLGSCSARLFPAGSVVVSSRAPVGYVAIAGQEMCTNQGCKTAIPPEFVESRYLYWYLVAAKADLESRASGTTFKEISAKRFAETRLRWPDRLEQQLIVEILEDHLSHLDAAADYASAAERRLSRLRDQLVRDAITGAVAGGDRRAPDLAAAGTIDGDLPTLPGDWRWKRLGDVADVVGGVTKDAKKQSDRSFVSVPYLRVANVQRGALRLDDVTSIRVSPVKADALRLQRGDVLLNEGGDRDKLARGWVWEEQIENCIHQNHVFRARPHDEIDPYFLSWCANTIGGRWAERNGKQSVNLASISLSMIRKMPVIVPPLEAARLVIAQLHDRLHDLDATVASIADSRARTSALRRAVLAAAFSGKLTGRHTDAEVIEEIAG